MNDFFNYENGVMSTIHKIADAVMLGMFWLVCSLPIFTIGASTTAFYYSYNKVVCQKRGYAWSEFFSSFKMNFKQATEIWLILLGAIVMSLLDCYILSFTRGTLPGADILIAIVIVVSVFGITWSLYLFPYLARFENSNKAVMKNSALILLANMPWSILLFVLLIIMVLGFIAAPVLNLFIPTIYMFLANKILERIFKKYMTPEELEKQTEIE